MEAKPIDLENLQVAAKNFQVPIDAISTPTLVLSPDFIMVAANYARLEVTGTKIEDILGRSVFDVFPDNPNDAMAEGVRNLRVSLERVLRDKVPDTMSVQKYDIPIPDSKTGEFEVRYWNPKNIPILDAEGNVTHILHQVEDVTAVMLGKDRLEMMSSEIYQRTNEVRSINAALKIAKEELEIKVAERTAELALARQKAEQAWAEIEESEAQLRELADAMPQLVIVSSPNGDVIYTNLRAQNYFGLAGEGIERWRFEPGNFFHPEDQKRAVSMWAEAIREEKPYEIEYRIRRKDGEYRWHLGRAVPVFDDSGNVTKWFATNTDIHEQILLTQELTEARQAAEAANATKSAFLANMSHEIRTPLAAIIGYTELLREPEVSFAEKERYLDTVIRSGKGLTRIIDDILDLAKVEAGMIKIEEVEFSTVEFMQEVLDLFRDKCRQKGIFLLLNIDKNVPPLIETDPTRLRQILVNIIGNALKFTTKGGVEVSVKSERREQAHLELCIRVKDTGIGISASQIDKIFQPFVQADNSTTREYGGTGLGLVLSKRLATALGGDIALEDYEEGVGCTFVINLWTAIAHEEEGQTPVETISLLASNMSLRSKTLTGLRILLADDSSDNQFLVSRILRKHGAIVDLANDGEEAIRIALDSEFDLVLMDIQMPRVNGYEATRALRRAGFAKPIIALTAHAMAEDRLRSEEAGCSGHLTKPINQTELIESIGKQVRVENRLPKPEDLALDRSL